jgi:hypothetical protein
MSVGFGGGWRKVGDADTAGVQAWPLVREWVGRGGRCSHGSLVWGGWTDVRDAAMTGLQSWQPELGVDGQRWEMQPWQHGLGMDGQWWEVQPLHPDLWSMGIGG